MPPRLSAQSNESVEKVRTLRFLRFPLYFGYAFTPQENLACIVERSMRSHFVSFIKHYDLDLILQTQRVSPRCQPFRGNFALWSGGLGHVNNLEQVS